MYLLAEILGWEPFFVRRDNIACGSDGAGVGLPARLRLRQSGTIILVETDDAVLREQLARTGLDRLVPPVPLLALEQLLVFAD